MALGTHAQLQEAAWAGLMRAAQQGDARSYEQLLRAIAPFIRSLARRYSRGTASAEDVVQEQTGDDP